ncbi:MAG: hypothetical protein EBX86_06395 [Actinobacteria bacterium]|nr:hypothetical protein [Actinomycetota bacterium]
MRLLGPGFVKRLVQGGPLTVIVGHQLFVGVLLFDLRLLVSLRCDGIYLAEGGQQAAHDDASNKPERSRTQTVVHAETTPNAQKCDKTGA